MLALRFALRGAYVKAIGARCMGAIGMVHPGTLSVGDSGVFPGGDSTYPSCIDLVAEAGSVSQRSLGKFIVRSLKHP
jgi:hypothetical protein